MSYLTVAATARAFMVSRGTLYRWFASGLPRNDDGTLSVYDVHYFLIRRLRSKLSQPESLRDRLTRVKILYKQAMIDLTNRVYLKREDCLSTLRGHLTRINGDWWINDYDALVRKIKG